MKSLEKSDEEQVRLFSLEKERLGETLLLSVTISKEVAPRWTGLFSNAISNEIRWNYLKLHQGRFKLETRSG